jgi:hypothetical protein
MKQPLARRTTALKAMTTAEGVRVTVAWRAEQERDAKIAKTERPSLSGLKILSVGFVALELQGD